MNKPKFEIGNNYGFKANPRQSSKDLPWYIEWIEKVGLPTLTTQRVLILVFVTVLTNLFIFLYIGGNLLKVKYLLLPLLMIGFAIFGYTLMYSLVTTYNGSVLKSTHIFFRQIIKRIFVLMGNANRDIENGTHTVLDDGTIIMADGQVAYMAKVEGSTSASNFPSEMARQEQKGKDFHNSRNRGTTIIQITSSQKQNTEDQLMNNLNLQRFNTNKAILHTLKQDQEHMEQDIDNRMPTSVQHHIYSDKRLSEVKDQIRKVKRFEARGYFNSVVIMEDPQEIKKVLGDLLTLK